MKSKNIFFILCFYFCILSIKAQRTIDSVSLGMPVKYNLYQTFNECKVKTAANKEVAFINYIRTDRKFKNKPTLVFTWFTFDRRGKKILDSLATSTVFKKYNIVAINCNSKRNYEKDSDFILKTSNENPLYDKNLISLFDFQSELTFEDRQAAPMLFWLDKDLKIVGSTVTSGITINQIESLLSLVELKKIIPSQTKFYTNQMVPCLENNASFKQVITESNGVTNLKVYLTNTNQIDYECNFTKSKQGNYYFKDNMYIKKKPFVSYKSPDLEINRNVGLRDRETNLYDIKSDFTLIYFCDISNSESSDSLGRLRRLYNDCNNVEKYIESKIMNLEIVVVFTGVDANYEKNNFFESNTENRRKANKLTFEFYKIFDKDKKVQSKFENSDFGSFKLLDKNKNVVYESADDTLFAFFIEGIVKNK
ncbi:hypothetical protein IU405_01815 [Polaribacter sp. BAL334]|uniref:hypothetical protein n=1 Tax=Polaribacter sp. BAL334 TaxID=1708178 RepID=UPI0018D214AE|nr:hypothetical protein [Polaribacter sp. BAL334]MBG7610980.1 hypothetical protein [Polaribacter sp. BAL334]